MSRRNSKERYIGGMRGEQAPSSQLSAHLAWIASQGEDGSAVASELRNTLVKTFTTDEGVKALMLMEKSVLLAGVPNGSSDGALREMNAVRNFVLDIRRIVSNG